MQNLRLHFTNRPAPDRPLTTGVHRIVREAAGTIGVGDALQGALLAQICVDRRGLWLQVANGMRGVHINGRPVKRMAVLRPGDAVYVEGVELLLQSGVLLLRLIGLKGARIQTCTFTLLAQLLALVFEKTRLGAGVGNLDLTVGQVHQVIALGHVVFSAQLLRRQHGRLGFLHGHRRTRRQLRVGLQLQQLVLYLLGTGRLGRGGRTGG